MLYLHGGGYCMLSTATHRGLTSKFSKLAGIKVLGTEPLQGLFFESSLTPISPAYGQPLTIGWRPSTRSLRRWRTPLRSTLGLSTRKAGYLSLSLHYLPSSNGGSYSTGRSQRALQGYEPQNVVIGGDSAGGGLTLATVLRCAALLLALPLSHHFRERTNLCFYFARARDQGLPLPSAIVCLSPWVHHTTPTRKEEVRPRETNTHRYLYAGGPGM
jgi:hypothetical protein